MDDTPDYRLYKKLADGLNDDELQDLCFFLNIDYENLAGQTKKAKARALVQLAQRTAGLAKLEETYHRVRDNQTLINAGRIQRTAANIRQNPWLFLSIVTLFIAALWFTGWLLASAVHKSLCILLNEGNPCPPPELIASLSHSGPGGTGQATNNSVTSLGRIMAVAVGGLVGGGLGGAVTAFGLSVTRPALQGRPMAMIAAGWAMAWAVGYAVDEALVLTWNVREFTNTFLAWALAALLGIEILRLTVRSVGAVVDGLQVALSWMGWLLGWGVGYYTRSVFGNDVGWSLSWFLGGGLTFLAFNDWFYQLLKHVRQEGEG